MSTVSATLGDRLRGHHGADLRAVDDAGDGKRATHRAPTSACSMPSSAIPDRSPALVRCEAATRAGPTRVHFIPALVTYGSPCHDRRRARFACPVCNELCTVRDAALSHLPTRSCASRAQPVDGRHLRRIAVIDESRCDPVHQIRQLGLQLAGSGGAGRGGTGAAASADSVIRAEARCRRTIAQEKWPHHHRDARPADPAAVLHRLPVEPFCGTEGGLALMLSSYSAGKPVTIGRANGVITIDLVESLDAYRESLRVRLGGRPNHARTLPPRGRPLLPTRPRRNRTGRSALYLDNCRELFGDERADYQAEISRPTGRARRRVVGVLRASEYATVRPWEDFAECFAHYLHITDTIRHRPGGGPGTARRSGSVLVSAGRRPIGKLRRRTHRTPACYRLEMAGAVLQPRQHRDGRIRLSVRGFRHRRGKLGFIHRVIRQTARETPPRGVIDMGYADELFDLTDRVVLVTGGSRGLGREMAFAAAHCGADVVIASRKYDTCLATAEEIAAATGRAALPYQVHVGRWDELDGLVDAAYDRFGKVDVLINNAGMSPLYESLGSVTEKLFDSVVNLNLKGPFRLSTLVGERMVADGGGSIINVSSSGSRRPRPEQLPYSAAKAGLNALTEGLALAFGPTVRVNTLMPGPFLTDISKAWDIPATTKGAQSFALKRLGQPAEIIGAALFLRRTQSSCAHHRASSGWTAASHSVTRRWRSRSGASARLPAAR